MDGVKEQKYASTVESNEAVFKWQDNPSWDNRPDAKEIIASIERVANRLYKYGR